MRQRVSKAFILSELINTGQMEKEDRNKVVNGFKTYLNPHEVSTTIVKDGWAELRGRRR